MKYFAVPDTVLEDDEELHSWAHGAIAAAVRKAGKRVASKNSGVGRKTGKRARTK
jgi:TfoX/Sxy family transcriptional regulator of competence genes